ncbi:MAG: hypothetical protein DRG09_06160 [Epsilonproteobacteria bacterium]|nr:MAG: hypothetical protein DRG09_06160 [Campylobacterota bacterium]
MQYLIENQNIPSTLEPHIKDTPSLHNYFEIRFDGIRPKNYCGFLSINNESYFIIPKISDDKTQNLNTFIYMLLYPKHLIDVDDNLELGKGDDLEFVLEYKIKPLLEEYFYGDDNGLTEVLKICNMNDIVVDNVGDDNE